MPSISPIHATPAPAAREAPGAFGFEPAARLAATGYPRPVRRADRAVLSRVLLLVALGGALMLFAPSAQAESLLPPGFVDVPVAGGFSKPIDMEFAPDGRLFVAEQGGRIVIVKPDGTLTTFLNFSWKVDSTGDRGMTAIAFDPNFSATRYVYLHYTKKAVNGVPVHNRVVRVTADGNRMVAGSEKLLLRLNEQRSVMHLGGAIDFGSDGKLYVATGDDDAGANAQSLTNLFGKILRINRDGTIPATNPFSMRTTGRNRAIWALGLRNPFKFAVHPHSGTILINDVGENAWEEIDQGASGANYGWDLHEGPESDPGYADPIYAYPHDGDPATSGCAITGGAFYAPGTASFPPDYHGDYFFAEFCNGWISSFDQVSGVASGFATGLVRVVDLEVGKTGDLYYLGRLSGVRKIAFGSSS